MVLAELETRQIKRQQPRYFPIARNQLDFGFVVKGLYGGGIQGARALASLKVAEVTSAFRAACALHPGRARPGLIEGSTRLQVSCSRSQHPGRARPGLIEGERL